MSPADWITGQPLTTNHLRALENARKLDRHHVFPKAVLQKAGMQHVANHGLNGVLLSKASNQRLYKSDPIQYLDHLQQTFGEDELRDRVVAHLVPYDSMWTKGNVSDRYGRFLKHRAAMVVDKMRNLGNYSQ